MINSSGGFSMTKLIPSSLVLFFIISAFPFAQDTGKIFGMIIHAKSEEQIPVANIHYLFVAVLSSYLVNLVPLSLGLEPNKELDL